MAISVLLRRRKDKLITRCIRFSNLSNPVAWLVFGMDNQAGICSWWLSDAWSLFKRRIVFSFRSFCFWVRLVFFIPKKLVGKCTRSFGNSLRLCGCCNSRIMNNANQLCSPTNEWLLFFMIHNLLLTFTFYYKLGGRQFWLKFPSLSFILGVLYIVYMVLWCTRRESWCPGSEPRCVWVTLYLQFWAITSFWRHLLPSPPPLFTKILF